MRGFLKVFVLAAFAGATVLSPEFSGAESLGAMRVRLVQGDVQVKIADTGDWAPVSVNMPLVEGDELWVPEDGRGELQTSNGAIVRLGENTAFQVLRMDRDSFQFYLAQGRAYVMTRAPKRSVIQFDTPDASIRAFGSSTFRIDIPDGETDISVLRGSVLAENDAGTTRVEAGDMLALAPDGYAELSPLQPPDDWQVWNAQRDRIVLARREGSRYLPEELRVYSSDFNDGRWVYVQDHGYCWTPTVVVIHDWAPYRHGRWVWRGGEYVWIGYEPWGWAPYHYGRWAFVPRIGWCWVPPRRGDVYWSPGYVAWVHSGDYVAWVPLAPREVYYGYGHYGRHSVDLRKVDVTRVRVTNVFLNVNVTNSVTVVHRTTFVSGRPVHVHRDAVVNVRDDFVRRRNVVVGRPAIKPVEASHHPVVRSIPETKRPPAAVRKIDVKELKRTRTFVREPDRSARRPQAKPRPLEIRKFESPRSPGERTIERQQVRPAERRGPSAPQVVPPGPADDRGRPVQAIPQERRREAPQAERPDRRGRPKVQPPETAAPEAQPAGPRTREERGGRPVRTVPQQGVRPERPQAAPGKEVEKEGVKAPPEERMERGGARPKGPPPETAAPEAQPTGPRIREERGGRPAQPAPKERVRPGRPQTAPGQGVEKDGAESPPAEKVRPDSTQGGRDRSEEGGDERGGRRKRVSPDDKGKPQEPPDNTAGKRRGERPQPR